MPSPGDGTMQDGGSMFRPYRLYQNRQRGDSDLFQGSTSAGSHATDIIKKRRLFKSEALGQQVLQPNNNPRPSHTRSGTGASENFIQTVTKHAP